MSKELRIHSQAAAEFEEAIDYYETPSPGLGQDLRNEVERSLVRIETQPSLHPPHGRGSYRKRCVDRCRYIIFFLELPEVVWVAAVAHASRRPGYWINRSPDDAD